MIEISIKNISSEIEGLTPEQASDIKTILSYEVPGAYYSQKYQSKVWDGRTYFFKKDRFFPTGLIHYIRAYLRNNDLPYNITDLRVKPALGSQISFKKPIEYREYQEETIEKAIKAQRGIIKLATAGGKAIILTSLVARLNVPTLIVVHRNDILYTVLKETLEEFLGIEVGVICQKEKIIKQVTVASIFSLASCFKHKIFNKKNKEIADFVNTCKMIIIDETQHLPTNTAWTVFNRAYEAYYKFGLSATPFRTDNKDIMIEAATAQKIIDISASNLIKQGYLAKPHIFFFNYKRPDLSGIRAITERANDEYTQIYQKAIVECEERNNKGVEIALREIKKGSSVLIAVTRVEHGKLLEEKLKQVINPDLVRFAHGELKREEREQILKDLSKKKIMVVVHTLIFNEGINLPSLNCLIDMKGSDSEIDTYQLAGRVLRKSKGKFRTLIFYPNDRFKYFGKRVKKKLEIFELEPAFSVRMLDENYKSTLPKKYGVF